MGKKKTVWNSQKNWVKIARYTLFSFLFNLCGSPGFITGVRIKKIQRTFSFRGFGLIIVHFLALFCAKLGRNWVLVKWKKSWNSPGKVLEFCFPIFVRTLIDIWIQGHICGLKPLLSFIPYKQSLCQISKLLDTKILKNKMLIFTAFIDLCIKVPFCVTLLFSFYRIHQ